MSRGADFWSQRRAAVAREEAAETREAQGAARDRARDAAEARPDDEILAEHGLPDPDALQPGDDVAGFMHAGIPERLRRRALRRLWRLNPVLANLDGLNDYDGDFTNAATDAPGVSTTYRVGRGLLRHVEALQAEARAATATATAEHDPESETPAKMENPAEITQENQASAPASATKVALADIAPPDDTGEADREPARPRRMRFTFEDDE